MQKRDVEPLQGFYARLRRLWRRQGPVHSRKPAVSIEKSVTPNVLICLETGTRHVTLRRHLALTLGLSPTEYRRRWGLPDDYPMVADNYVTAKNKTIFGTHSKVEQESR